MCYTLLMMANKPETALYRAAYFSLGSHKLCYHDCIIYYVTCSISKISLHKPKHECNSHPMHGVALVFTCTCTCTCTYIHIHVYSVCMHVYLFQLMCLEEIGSPSNASPAAVASQEISFTPGTLYMYIPYSGLFSWVQIFVKCWRWPSELNIRGE